MMDEKGMFSLVPQALEQLPHGVFLTVGGERWNPMTIGWAQFGVIWGKPIVNVLVRRSRYTHSLLEQTDVFTISVPKAGGLADELAYCGSHSGRNADKRAETGLTPLPARAGGADGVAGCGCYFECRVVEKLFEDHSELEKTLHARYYGANQITPDGDPHDVYFGELLAAYPG